MELASQQALEAFGTLQAGRLRYRRPVRRGAIDYSCLLYKAGIRAEALTP